MLEFSGSFKVIVMKIYVSTQENRCNYGEFDHKSEIYKKKQVDIPELKNT